MTSKNDVVIGVIKGYSWDHIKNYALSLASCGFRGTKLMLVSNVSDQVVKNLIALGFVVEHFDVKGFDFNVAGYASAGGFIACGRFIPVIDYLKKNAHRYAFWCDVRDLVFQSDPSKWLEENIGDAKILAGSECVAIKDEPTNDMWCRNSGTISEYENIKNEDVVCAGCVGGDAGWVLKLIESIYEYTSKHISMPLDQGRFNHLIRQSPFKEVTRIPKMHEGFIVTGSSFVKQRKPNDESPILSDGFLKTQSGKSFSIVHQYDRFGDWQLAIHNRLCNISVPAKKLPKTLIAVCSWSEGSRRGDHKAMRNFIFSDLKKYPGLDYKFFVGDGTPTGQDEALLEKSVANCPHPSLKSQATIAPLTKLESDEVAVQSPDDYKHISFKVHQILWWAYARNYEFVFLCYPDTFINISRLVDSAFERYDYSGLVIGNGDPHNTKLSCRYAKGGQGHWLSRKAIEKLLYVPIDDWAIDRWVGKHLEKAGIVLHHDNRYVDYPKFPKADNNYITSHLAENSVYDNSMIEKLISRWHEATVRKSRYAADGLTIDWFDDH